MAHVLQGEKEEDGRLRVSAPNTPQTHPKHTLVTRTVRVARVAHVNVGTDKYTYYPDLNSFNVVVGTDN